MFKIQSNEMDRHTRHILPPSEIDLGLFLAVLQAQKGNTYFTELAERLEYGNYGIRTAAFRPKVLHLYSLDSIRISLSRGKIPQQTGSSPGNRTRRPLGGTQ